MKWLMCLLCVGTTVLICTSSVNGQQNSPSYTASERPHTKTISNNIWFDTALNHLTVDKNSGRLFIGGVNRLYQLSADLDVEAVAVTGPRNDSTDCGAHECRTADTVRTLIDNYNKVLLIDYSRSCLITCGSLFQGACTVRNLENVSIIEEEILDVAVAANNGIASTVAFIAPGPHLSPIENVMYVGVTYTGDSPYRDEIPAVSSRSLERGKLFQIESVALTSGTFMFFNAYARGSYIVDYVYGFSSEGFSYFFTIQWKHSFIQKSYVTKLVRICQADSHYYSYTEIPVACNSDAQDGTKYNLVRAAYLGKPGAFLAESLGITPQDDVLYAVFSDGERDVPSNRSALCIYSLKAIRRKFLQNIKTCFNGIGDRGLDFISPNMLCVATKLQTIREDFCGLDVNSPLGGTDPIVAVATILMPHHLTAVAATSTSGYTVLFLGTQKGHLKKVLVESVTSAVEYGEIVIDEDSKINADMLYDAAELNLYVMTVRRVAKISLFDCASLLTCDDCLKAKDPYCGWCSSETKCSLRSNCLDDKNGPSVWVGSISGKCPTIMNVSPHQLERTTVRTLELHIDHLPAIAGKMFCAFAITDGGQRIYTFATRTRHGVNCTTPATDLLSHISQGKHSFTTKLSVIGMTDKVLASTNFTFFDCSTYVTCTQCASSQFPCAWCVEAHICTHDASTVVNCRNGILVTGVANAFSSSFSRVGGSSDTGSVHHAGPDFCPRINAAGNDSEILVASGATKSIQVKLDIIERLIAKSQFACQFNIGGRITVVSAQLLLDTIYCDPMEFAYYTSKLSYLTAILTVLWNENRPLDNPHNVHIVIYRCSDMADNCGTCLLLQEKYGCGWCQSTSSCEIADQCSKHMEQKTNWLNPEQTCTDPTIHSFKPIVGPCEGGTNITIRGINLGKKFVDIYSNSSIKVAGINCKPYKDLYVGSKEIVCNVDGLGTQKYRHGKIVVEIADYRGESPSDYEFVDPQIEDFNPKLGPISGGTLVSIIGKHLDAGSRIKAFIGERSCEILNVGDTQALCRTSAAKNQNVEKLKMTFDNGVREFDGDPFIYVKDPTIDYVASGPTGRWKSAKGIPAGGIKIVVIGNQFEAIQQPTMYVYYEGKMYHSECNVVSNTEMMCYSPSIEDPYNRDQLMNTDTDTPTYLEYGFKMDNVVEVQNISQKENHHPFELYPNPVYWKFEENVKYHKSEYLTIYGENLNLACSESDIIVMVGNEICNITSLSRQLLTCRPPVEVSDENQAPTVTVIVGKVLTYELGVFSYASPNLHSPNRSIFFAVIAGIFVFVLINFIFCYVRNHRSNPNVQNNSKRRTGDSCDSVFNSLHENRTSGTSPSLWNAKYTKTGRGEYYERPLSYEEPIYAEIEEHLGDEYDKLNFSPCKSQDVYNIPALKNCSMEPCT